MRIYKDKDILVIDGERCIQFIDQANTKTGACITIDLPQEGRPHLRIENISLIMRREEDREAFKVRLRNAWRYLWQKKPTWWSGMNNVAIPFTMPTKEP